MGRRTTPPPIPLSLSPPLSPSYVSHFMRVTAIRKHPRHPGRFVLETDASTKLTISLELIPDLKRKVGRVLDEAEQRRLEASAQAIACYDKAHATLEARSRSVADLRRDLRTKEFTDGQITPAIEKLTALGLLDDVAYAHTFVRVRLAPSRGFGPRPVAAELARKGVARDNTERVLGELALEREEHADDAADTVAISTTRRTRDPRAEGIAMMTSAAPKSRIRRGRSSMWPSTRKPLSNMPSLLESSSTKATTGEVGPLRAHGLAGNQLPGRAGADDDGPGSLGPLTPPAQGQEARRQPGAGEDGEAKGGIEHEGE